MKKTEIDPDKPLTDEEWEAMGPVMRFHELPEDARKAIEKLKRGRPKASETKEKVTIRLDADLLAELRQSGKGWQTRLNDAIRHWLHP